MRRIIRLIHQAFPDYRVVFHARTAHLTSLSARLTDLDRIDMRACPAFAVPFELSHHSPLAGRWAAAKTARDMRDLLGHRSPALVAVLGVDAEVMDDGPVRIGFLGHSSRTKGFHLFADLARNYPGARQLEAIGMWAPDTKALDLSGLELLPMRGGLPRADYLKQLSVIDMVCLPLSSRAYDFIASGPVSDSIAALKPLIALRTRTLAAVWERYGPIGFIAETEQDLTKYVSELSRCRFEQQAEVWRDNLRKIRHARLPASLAKNYPPVDDVSAAQC